MDTASLQTNLTPMITKFYHWETNTPDSIFLKQPYGNSWKSITYKEAGQEARKILTALKALGLERGTHIAILSKNCYHWIIADLAIMMGGYVSVPLYYNTPKEQLREILIKGDVKAIFIGKLDNFGDKAEAIPADISIIRMPHYRGNAEISVGLAWEKLLLENIPSTENYIPDLDSLWKIKFTSGTTGSPKGVMLNHRIPSMLMRGQEISGNLAGVIFPKQHYFSFLPLNHIAETMGIFMACLFNGGTISFVESVESFSKNIQDTQPGFLFVVPRILTKFHLGVLGKISQERLDILLKIPLLSSFIKQKIRKNLGLSRLKFGYTGAAITPQYLKEWFKKLDLHFWEVYGMTETGGTLTLGFYENTPPDSVGKVLPFGELKIDEQTDEILAKVPWIMQGYYKEPQKTAEVLQNGWYHTGDKGEIDAQGFLKVTGRVQDTFKTNKGEFIVPNPIEEELLKHHFIELVCVVGLGVTQPIALLNLSEIGNNTSKTEIEQQLLKLLQKINHSLNNHTKISTLVITKSWTVENELLTPTLKVRRVKIDEHYQSYYEQWHQSPKQIIWENSLSHVQFIKQKQTTP